MSGELRTPVLDAAASRSGLVRVFTSGVVFGLAVYVAAYVVARFAVRLWQHAAARAVAWSYLEGVALGSSSGAERAGDR